MRSRNLKPGFFKNEQLAECSPIARLLFAGLWCIADREGRLEDRPKRIKAELLPYDDAPVERLLDELSVRGFITRYGNGESRYIAVTNFRVHQHPHVKEGASSIPAPDEYETSTAQTPYEPGGFPLTDSLLPHTDLLIPDSEVDDARARDDVDDLISSTADLITGAAFINDEPDDVRQAVARSFTLTPVFNARDGPREAEKFVRYYARRKRALTDWYVTWLGWIKRAADQQPKESADESYADKVRRWKASGLVETNG